MASIERIIVEARSTGKQIVHEAEDQRNRTLAQLEKERSGLEHKIDELRRFETNYRTRLKSYLHNLLMFFRSPTPTPRAPAIKPRVAKTPMPASSSKAELAKPATSPVPTRLERRRRR